jgi:membrane fusion protein (multidrug efflux system)
MPRWFGWTALIVILAATVGWFGQSWLRPPALEVVLPVRGDAAAVVYASGVTEPVRWAKVSPLVRERIIDICNCEGETVSRGDQLAALESSALRARIAEAKARADLARQELERATNLWRAAPARARHSSGPPLI